MDDTAQRAGTTGDATPLLDDQLCFALYAASRAVIGFYRPMLEKLDLTYPQYLVLLALWERDDRTVKELGEALQLDYGTLSPLLKRMEVGGLVRRERRREDERTVRVVLADRGRSLDACVDEVMPAVIGATGLDAASLEAMRAELRLLADTVARATRAAAEELRTG